MPSANVTIRFSDLHVQITLAFIYLHCIAERPDVRGIMVILCTSAEDCLAATWRVLFRIAIMRPHQNAFPLPGNNGFDTLPDRL